MAIREKNVSFLATKLLVLSDLTTKEKEKYYQLLHSQDCKFRQDIHGRYITDLRILGPRVKKIDRDRLNKARKDLNNYALTFQQRLKRLKEEGLISVQIVGIEYELDYQLYPRFASLIAFQNDTIQPKQRPVSWIMKIVEDIYDHRFSHEKNEVEREEDSPSFDLMLVIFPVFVVRRLGTNVGLKTLMDQTCWDLLYNTHIYRKDYLELEIFGRFLQEFYDHDDLLFFLYVRSVIMRVLHIGFKSRWTKSDGPGRQPKSLWMSYRECVHVARIVFGQDNEMLFRDFMALIIPQMVGQRTDISDSRRIDVTEYLHLSVVGYHQSQSRNTGNPRQDLVPIPGQLTPPIPVPQLMENSYFTQHPSNVVARKNEDEHDTRAYRSGEDFDHDRADDDMEAEFDEKPSRLPRSRDNTNVLFDPEAEARLFADEYRRIEDADDLRLRSDHDVLAKIQEIGIGVDDMSMSVMNGPTPVTNPINNVAWSSHSEEGFEDNHMNALNLESLASMDLNDAHHVMSQPPPVRGSSTNQLPDLIGHKEPVDNRVENEKEQEEEDEEEEEDGEEEEDDEENREMQELQIQRELEFLSFVMKPVQGSKLPTEYIKSIQLDISERLRQTVNLFLSTKDNIVDVDTLDECLLEILQSPQLRSDMEGIRDELITHFKNLGSAGEAEGDEEDEEGEEEENDRGDVQEEEEEEEDGDEEEGEEEESEFSQEKKRL